MYLLVVSFSRARIYRNTEKWNDDVEDFLSANPEEEEETEQATSIQLSESDQDKDAERSYDLSTDLPVIKRRYCRTASTIVDNARYFKCRNNCRCQGETKLVKMCKKCK